MFNICIEVYNGYSVNFNLTTSEKSGPLTFSEDFSQDDITGIREYASLNPQDEDTADLDLGRVLDILKDPNTEARLLNLTRLPISSTVGEVSERIVNKELVRELDKIRETAPPAPLPQSPDKIFSRQEITLLHKPDSVQFSPLVVDLVSQPATQLLTRPGTPVAFSDLSDSNSSMSAIEGEEPTDPPSRNESPVSDASSVLLVDSLFDFTTPNEEMLIDRSQEIKGKMASRKKTTEHSPKATSPILEKTARLEDDSLGDQESDGSKSVSSYYEEPASSANPPTKEVQTLGPMSTLALEVEEANHLLERSPYSTPEDLFKTIDKQAAVELGITPLLYSGIAYLAKASNVHMSHIQALNLATTEVSKVASRTEDKIDLLKGDLNRLCSEIGGLTAEVKKNSLGITLLQSTLEKLLVSRFSPRDDPPPPSARTTTRPPNDPPTATVAVARPISYEQYRSMGMAERLRYRKAGGIVPCAPGHQAATTFASERALPLQSQPLVSFSPIEKPDTIEQPAAIVQLRETSGAEDKSVEAKKKMRKRTKEWRYYTQVLLAPLTSVYIGASKCRIEPTVYVTPCMTCGSLDHRKDRWSQTGSPNWFLRCTFRTHKDLDRTEQFIPSEQHFNPAK